MGRNGTSTRTGVRSVGWLSGTRAAQDFVQKEPERVADFVRHMERAFHNAYGGDSMGKETCEVSLWTTPGRRPHA